MIHLEPRQNALSVEVMLAAKEKDFVSSSIGFNADGAHVIFLDLLHLLGVKFSNKGIFHAMVSLHLIKHLLVIDLLERFAVDAVQGRFKGVRIAIQHTFILVVPINPV